MLHESKASVPYRLSKCFLVRELPDALHQVLVAVPVPGYDLAQGRDKLEGVGVIENVQTRHRDLGELQTQKASSWLEHPPGLSQGCVNLDHVPDAKCDGVAVKTVVFKCQRLSV